MRRGRTGGERRWLVVAGLLAVVLVAALLVLRSRGNDVPSVAEVAERQESCARLVTFSSLVGDPGISPPLPTSPVRPEAVANLFTRMGSDVDLLVERAPGEVRGDVRALVTALRAHAGDPAAVRSPSFGEARDRLQGFLNDPKNGCQTGSESGDG